VVGGLIWYQVADRKAREAEERAQIADGYQKAKSAISETVASALKFADEFEVFAKRAVEECDKPTDAIAKLLSPEHAALLKPATSKELEAAIAATNDAPKAVEAPAPAPAGTNAVAAAAASNAVPAKVEAKPAPAAAKPEAKAAPAKEAAKEQKAEEKAKAVSSLAMTSFLTKTVILSHTDKSAKTMTPKAQNGMPTSKSMHPHPGITTRPISTPSIPTPSSVLLRSLTKNTKKKSAVISAESFLRFSPMNLSSHARECLIIHGIQTISPCPGQTIFPIHTKRSTAKISSQVCPKFSGNFPTVKFQQ
jgi:hypothetical protein